MLQNNYHKHSEKKNKPTHIIFVTLIDYALQCQKSKIANMDSLKQTPVEVSQ